MGRAIREIALDPKLADLYAGLYKITTGPATGMVITIERQGANLALKNPTTPPEGLQLHAENERTLFTTVADLQVTFQRDGDGLVVSLTVHFAGADTVAPRIAPRDQ